MIHWPVFMIRSWNKDMCCVLWYVLTSLSTCKVKAPIDISLTNTRCCKLPPYFKTHVQNKTKRFTVKHFVQIKIILLCKRAFLCEFRYDLYFESIPLLPPINDYIVDNANVSEVIWRSTHSCADGMYCIRYCENTISKHPGYKVWGCHMVWNIIIKIRDS